MRIFIPTAGRPDRQITSDALCEAGIDHYVVGDLDDLPPLREHRGFLRYEMRGIRGKRQYIFDFARGEKFDKILMLDDDLVFRKRNDEGKFLRAEPGELPDLINTLADLLEDHAHVGILDEFMSHTQPRVAKYHGRYNQVLGYNLRLFPDIWPSFRIEINEEHDFHLQLGAAGLAPAISCEWTKSSKPYSAGGCAVWRTPEVEREGHEALARNFPDLVTVVPAKSLSGWGIRVKWKDAIRSVVSDAKDS